MGKKIYVGNLPYSTTNDDLTNTFSAFGTVESARIVMDRETNRSKGFGFVEMSTDEEASTAISKLNGSEFGGRQMNVSEAKPQAPREGGGGGHRGGGRSFGGGGGNRNRY
jgi:RNA recognition motif-containing protein